MADSDTTSGVPDSEDKALEGISVAPPAPMQGEDEEADAKLDHDLEETFPSSDAPSSTRPGSSGEPAPSSGYDPDAEPD